MTSFYDQLAQNVIDCLDRNAGFDHWWDSIEEDTKQEILNELSWMLERRIDE